MKNYNIFMFHTSVKSDYCYVNLTAVNQELCVSGPTPTIFKNKAPS